MGYKAYKHVLSALVFYMLGLITLYALCFFHNTPQSLIHLHFPLSTSLSFFQKIFSWYACSLLFLFGCSCFVLVPLFFWCGYLINTARPISNFVCKGICLLLSLSLFLYFVRYELLGGFAPGGYWGTIVIGGLEKIFDQNMIMISVYGFFCLSIMMLMPFYVYVKIFAFIGWVMQGVKRISWVGIAAGAFLSRWFRALFAQYQHEQKDISQWLVEELIQEDLHEQKATTVHEKYWQTTHHPVSVSTSEEAEILSTTKSEEKRDTQADKPFELPGSSFFEQKIITFATQTKEHEHNALLLQEKLRRFGITGTVSSIVVGPVVTLFEYKPHIAVKISKILALEDDLALALKAMSLRIIAPIPGKSAIGFEVAHVTRHTIYFGDIFAEYKGNLKLPLMLGKDAQGRSVFVDLVELPHLLVAGSTGSGKSVVLNALIMSLLCTQDPHTIKFILIDPKRLEFTPYADCPHLIFPIITEMVYVRHALMWAVKTMEERYKIMAEKSVRNIHEYHAQGYKNMPFIVIIIDEIADIFMTGGHDIENLVIRLAQMARACGIHLVIATQRPSVDIITGLIKVNFPARLACKVASKIDSRTILDTTGAEKLLGKGDMLFLDQHGVIKRVHGALVVQKEIQAIVSHSKQQMVAVYEELPEHAAQYDEESDVLLAQIIEFVQQHDEISISLIQRRFRIGYNRSARIVELLEQKGYVLPVSGSKMRKVLR
ncbi:MAG: DNA translocase FtsK [Candidatus Babeliaceae bacterium]